MPPLQPWPKIGNPRILAKHYGKTFLLQTFREPGTNKDIEFSLFGQPDWCVVLPLTPSRQVIAVEQYKQGCDRIVLELPAGTLEPDEDPLPCAQRELLEETGYSSELMSQLGGALYMASRNSWTRFFPFLALNCVPNGEQTLDEHEEILIKTIPLDEWVRLCMNDVVEPSAIVATFRAIPLLGYNLLP